MHTRYLTSIYLFIYNLGWVPVDLGPASLDEINTLLTECKVTMEIPNEHHKFLFLFAFSCNLWLSSLYNVKFISQQMSTA